jgi:hypothetical protein
MLAMTFRDMEGVDVPTTNMFNNKGAWARLREQRYGNSRLTLDLIGVPERNRTSDPRFRKPVLYPAELPGPGRRGREGRCGTLEE